MPIYEYLCPANGRTVEVRHGMDARIDTWGALAERAGISTDDLPSDTPVERILSAPASVGATDGGEAGTTGPCGSACGCFPRA